MQTPLRHNDWGSRIVAGVAVRVTERVWPDQRRSFQVHLLDADVDLTENGGVDDPPTDAQISDLLADHPVGTTPAGRDNVRLLRELLTAATARVGWQVDINEFPVTCAHTPTLVVALIDACAAHVASLAINTILIQAARSLQDAMTGADPDSVDWFTAGLLGGVAELANSRSANLGYTRRTLVAALRPLRCEGAAWPSEPDQPITGPETATGTTDQR